MITKKLIFDNDVLDIIRLMRWDDDGKLGVLTSGQLDRKMYMAVNKALAAMGGKWNRNLGGHVFPQDPRPTVEGLLDDGSLLIELDGFFETPLPVVKRMIELVSPRGMVLEPSAGLGAIARHLAVAKDCIVCVEKNEQRVTTLREMGYRVLHGDFLAHTGEYDTIFMNPPFEQSQDITHVQHAYNLLKDFGEMVSVMSEGPFFRATYKDMGFRSWLASVGGQSEVLPKDAFKKSGTVVSTRLVVIRKGFGHEPLDKSSKLR